MSLQELIKEVKALNRDEQQQLRKLLDEMLAQQEEAERRKAFHQTLLAAGLVKTIKTPRAASTRERGLIQVKGKPLSETIIEERR
jgi:hypothetical protein